jgi:hypothetical protein
VLRAVAAIVCGTCVLAASASTLPPGAKRHISWADARHGWVPNHKTFECADDHPEAVWEGTVCSTEDAGRRWRTIFRGGNYILLAVRTSPRAGVVSTGAHGHAEFWTRDNGRHWFPTDLLGGDHGLGAPPPRIVGNGHHLYWARQEGATVYRVTPWPPEEAAICAGQWAWSAFTTETADPNGSHCQGPAVEAGMRSRAVTTLTGASVVWLMRAPAGFLALYSRREPASRLTVAIHSRGSASIRNLPTPNGLTVVALTPRGLSVSWPFVRVRALARLRSSSPTSRLLTWRSDDGGRSWRVSSTKA